MEKNQSEMNMPYGKVLVVDDVESNLFIARDLMVAYKLTVETVTSGSRAIDKIEAGNVYDIIFMDHLMPKPDGIEATQIIRSFGYTAPIIALSANAAAGQAIIFLANGFDGFMQKPIDVRQLNSILKKYILDKQPSEAIDTLMQENVDGKIQPLNYGSHASVSPQLVEFFLKDAMKAIRHLQIVKGKHGNYDDEDIKLFTTTVHAMKSAFMNIGEMRLSAYAEEMEQAGWKNDTDTIHVELPVIINKLHTIIEKYKPLEVPEEDDSGSDYSYLEEQINAFKDACETFDKKAAKEIIIELKSFKWSLKIKELLGIISEQLLSGDIALALGSADKIISLVPRDYK